MRILIADDELITLKMLESVLSVHGYEIVTATDGTEAWRVLERDDAPRLAILDWTMPGLNGVEICRRLRERQTPTPTYVILLTGRTAKADVIAGLEAGANDFMTKPFDLDELRARVQVGRTVTELQANVANRMLEFQEYVEAAPMGVLVVQPDGRIVFANRSVHDCFGYVPGELTGLPIENLVPRAARNQYISLRDRYLQNPERRMLRNRSLVGLRKDGKDVPVAIGLNPVTRGNSVNVACAVMDLTELRRAEQDLERFFNLSLDLFIIANVEGYILRANPQLERLLGLSKEELLARPYIEWIHPDDVPAVRLQVEKLAAGQPVINFRCRLRDQLGNDHGTEWSAQSIAAEGIFYAVGRDITVRLQMENNLLAQEQRERAILDNTPAVIFVKGIDGRYQFVNRRFADVFSKAPEDCTGKAATEIFPAEIAETFEASDQQVLDSRAAITFQSIIRHDDGDHTYLAVKCPLFDPEGEISAIAGISTDITDQIHARKIADEFKLAGAFQRKLYPAKSPSVPGLDVAGSALPMTQMSGDYYDFVQTDPQRLFVTIGDVSGHGLGPALEMVQVRMACRLLLKHNADLTATLAELNGMLCKDLPESTFVTLFMAEVDVSNGKLRYLGAGHDAFLIRQDGTSVPLKATDLLLGVDPSLAFREVAAVDVGQGDVLLLFTDGMSDATGANGEYYSRERVIETVTRHRMETSEVMIQNLLQSIFEFSSGRSLTDDITCVIVKVVEPMKR